MKTKQQVHPTPRTGSKISGWLHLSKPTKKKEHEDYCITYSIYHKHLSLSSIEAQEYFFFIQPVYLILFHMNVRDDRI